MTVFVLGHRGLLGHVVARVLRQAGLDVRDSERRYTGRGDDALVADAVTSGASWVVNAIGALPGASEATLHLLNERLPLHLAFTLGPQQRLLHASTDGVYAGTRGAYRVDEPADALDPYGFSKRLGEACVASGRAHVLRTSIIGPALDGKRGLLSWALNQHGDVPGYMNQFWNGITTLEWAWLCHEICTGRHVPAAITHVASADRVSKAELLQIVYDVWQRGDVSVRPVRAAESLDRSLVPDLRRPAIRAQLERLRAWYSA